MATQGGSIKIVASVINNKTNKNCDYFPASVTNLIEVNCFGNQGTFIFISKGKMVGSKKYRELESNRSLTPLSHVVTSTNDYITD